MPAWALIFLFIILGLFLLVIELFIIPGFGFTGISGLILLGIAVYLAFKELSIFYALLVTVGGFFFVVLFINYFTKTKFSRVLSLETREEAKRGFLASADLKALTNKEGISITILRPTGMALIEGKKINVLSEGLFIEKGEKIKVVKVEGSKIIVRKREVSK